MGGLGNTSAVAIYQTALQVMSNGTKSLFEAPIAMVLPTPCETKHQKSEDDPRERGQESTTESIVGSLRNKLQQFSDSQRISRLEQCQALHGLLLQCRSRQMNTTPSHAPSLAATAEVESSIENLPAGIRMLRYFQWRDVSLSPDTKSLCRREEHALWACRAVAAGCGKPLVDLKSCFDRVGPRILDQDTFYEKSEVASSENSSPCAIMQHHMGKCVVDGITTLNDRFCVDEKPPIR